MVLDIYHNFCYRAFTNGIMKNSLDNANWNEVAILLHENKIEQEDDLIRLLEQEEKTEGFRDI